MFTHIMVPVDLAEKAIQGAALRVAADQARLYDARITLISVTGGLQAKVSHSAARYEKLLRDFADHAGKRHGVAFDTRVYDVPDPSVEVDRVLIEAIGALDIDLVVMATHQPGWVEYFVNSHGGRIAAHAPVSVFVVREGRGS